METVAIILAIWHGVLFTTNDGEPPIQNQIERRAEIIHEASKHKYDFSWITEDTEIYDD